VDADLVVPFLATTMLRKRARSEETNSEDSSSNHSQILSDDAVDISSSLTGKRRKHVERAENLEGDDPEEFSRFLREAIAKRDIKEGTQVVKNMKGRQNMAKGEVGGGSFQSMGMSFSS
jgi:ATP-dependent RNA helicase DDX54/DBP10